LGVFDVTGTGFAVVELAEGVNYHDVVDKTAAPVTDGRQRRSAASSDRERTPSLA
jgi:3-oxoacid CoA-transferase subunit B